MCFVELARARPGMPVVSTGDKWSNVSYKTADIRNTE